MTDTESPSIEQVIPPSEHPGDRIARLGFLTMDVEDLDAAVDFYTRVIRLEVTERRPGVAFLSGGKEHHWLRLEESTAPGVREVGFQVIDAAALHQVRTDLVERGITFTEGSDFAADRIDHWLRFREPSGLNIVLFLTMAELGERVEPNGIRLDRLLHALWVVGNYDESLRFAQEVLGFRVSDMIENAVVFLRCGNKYHHSFGFIRGPQVLEKPKFGHFCVLVDTIDDVMRYRNNALGMGLTLELDALHHPTSNSVGVYVEEPWQHFSIEFCAGHTVIEDDAHIPRQLIRGPQATDTWKIPLPPPRSASKVPFYEVLGLELGDASA